MKRINLILIVSCLLPAMACTTEELLPPKDSTKATAAACLSFNVHAESGQTKAGSSTTDGTTREDQVDDCSLILFNNDNTVYRAFDGLTVTNGRIQSLTGGTDPFLVQVKIGKTETNKVFKLLIIGNTTQHYATCADYDAVQSKLLDEDDLNRQVKVSEQIDVTIPKGFATLAEAAQAGNIVNREVVLKQLTARVELTDFTVTFKHGSHPTNVTVKDITLLNRNVESTTRIDDTSTLSLVNQVWTKTTGQPAILPVVDTGTTGNNFADVTDKPFFHTFPHFEPTSGKEMALRFTLSYDSADGTDEKTFECIINRPSDTGFTNRSGHTYVRAGYIYQLKINAALTSSIECTVQCDTRDWNYNLISYVL